jgi:hypothetical protein
LGTGAGPAGGCFAAGGVTAPNTCVVVTAGGGCAGLAVA